MSKVEKTAADAIDALRNTQKHTDDGTSGKTQPEQNGSQQKNTDASGTDSDQPAGDAKKHVFVLMDESGSMRGLEEAVTSGCNEFIHSFAEDAQARLWLAWFDQSPGEELVRMPVKGKPAAEVEQLTARNYNPRGMTPLNDAISTAVTTLDAVAGEDDVVFLAIITDGMENASETSTATVKQLLSAREEAGWGIVFIGANQDAVETAAGLGMVKPGQAFNFSADRMSVSQTMIAVKDLAVERSRHRAGKDGLDNYDIEAEKLFRDGGGRLDKRRSGRGRR